MFSKIALALILAASVAAQGINIVRPNVANNQWWVANSLNTLQWSPCDTTVQGSMPAFNVVVFNSDQTILAGNLTILGNEMTFECSKTITPALTPANGYTMMLTNAINTNQVYTSAQFNVEAAGSPYPAQSSAFASASGTASGASASQTSKSTKNGAVSPQVSLKNLLSTVFGIGAIGALL